MKTIKNKNYLGYLFWFGPFLSIMGITARIVANEWSAIALGLLITGLVIIGLSIVFLGSLAPGFWGRRSTQVGTNALIATLAMIVILMLINFLGVRYAQRVDLTENQLFTLSPQSQRVVQTLQQPLKVWVFDRSPSPADQDLLKNYRRYSSNFQFEYVDPQLKPTLAQKFNVQSSGQVYLEYGQERKLLQSVSPGERLSETRLTNGIENLANGRADTVYFLQGHGERPLEQVEGGLSQAVNALKEKNFTPQPLNLAERQDVPKDAALIVVAGPKRALLNQEVQALRNYLTSGGSVLLMLDPDAKPGLDSLLADWGVKLDNQIAIDASGQGRSAGLGPATSLVTNYGQHPITRDFGNNFSLYPLAQPVEIKSVEGVKETPLVQTSEQSWGESTPEKQPLQYDPQGDRPGPLTLGVALSRKPLSPFTSPAAKPEASPSPEASASPNGTPEASPSPKAQATASPEASASPNGTPEASPSSASREKADKRKSEARLVVFGNSNFATDGWFEQQLNGDVFLNSVGWLSKRDEQAFSIRPKEQKNRRINLTEAQSGMLGWTALLIMPLLGLTTAGVVWWRRR